MLQQQFSSSESDCYESDSFAAGKQSSSTESKNIISLVSISLAHEIEI